MQVKQFVAEVESDWCRFRVYETGDAKFWLFSQLDSHGCETTLQFPIRKTELRPEVRRALRHGVSFSMPAYRRTQEKERANER